MRRTASALAIGAIAVGGGAIGCGGEAEHETPPTTTTAPIATAVPEPPPPPTGADLSVHEWGLIDVPLSATTATASAVPACGDLLIGHGTPPPPTTTRPDPSHEVARPRAPMLYFHLPSGHAPIDVSVRVSLAGGGIDEHWPVGTLAGDAVSWTATVRPEHCAGSSYPSACPGGGLCEAPELGAYEATDASCVHVGDADFADLFYAGHVPLASPLRITRSGDAVTVLDDSDDALPGPVYLFHRAADRAATTASMTIAQPHAEATFPPLGPADQLTVRPFDVLRSQHLSEPETAAFTRAWDCAVYGGTREDGTPCSSEPQPTRFVLFWLPRARIDALAPLVIEPAPGHVERAILVRVDLDH